MARSSRLNLNRRTLLQAAGAGALTLAAPGILRAQSKRPAEVHIGSLFSLTGPAAAFGNSGKNTFELSINEINNAGGIWGDGTGIIKMTFADDQSKAEVGVAEIARLSRDPAIVTLPCLVAGPSILQSTIEAERQKISIINMASTPPEINERGLKYTFSTCNNADGMVKAYLEFTKGIIDKSGVKPNKVAFVFENKFGGPSYHRAFQKFAPTTVDWNIVESYPYDPVASDFGPLISRLKADEIDFPIVISFPQDAVLIVRAMMEQDYNPLGISSVYGAMPNLEFIQALGKAADYIMGQSPFLHDLNVPASQNFVKLFKEKTGRLPDPLAGVSYNGFNGVIAAIRAAEDPNDRDSVRDALAALDIKVGDQGVVIPDGIKISENGANPVSRGAYYQIRDGLHRAVLPAEFATTEVVYPRPKWDEIMKG
ncbi:ABC transporter substrate-binding protein [Tianweitania sediminis]|jgi:branched-chain amino acid transport system substrate-binding protein|uniref:ABC transporter substrate-binding protein n=1 Tax=Tianweitania sediminis TaxID=1502156 RepID=A0A8J7RQU1_9HYPH|nr:ABC transporter substrate-binding protein [Tianweitania sediminis]MBP0440379.1 ABC transporter substrate-binding protein [Tianweitania sediminis]